MKPDDCRESKVVSVFRGVMVPVYRQPSQINKTFESSVVQDEIIVSIILGVDRISV